MHDELRAQTDALLKRRRIAQQRLRCLKAAKLTSLGAASGVFYLSVRGMQSAAVTVPVVLAVLSMLFAAGSAAMFAHAARIYLETPGPDTDDDGGGPGWDSGEPPEAPGGGGLAVDWDEFERDFRSYCERVEALR